MVAQGHTKTARPEAPKCCLLKDAFHHPRGSPTLRCAMASHALPAGGKKTNTEGAAPRASCGARRRWLSPFCSSAMWMSTGMARGCGGSLQYTPPMCLSFRPRFRSHFRPCLGCGRSLQHMSTCRPSQNRSGSSSSQNRSGRAFRGRCRRWSAHGIASASCCFGLCGWSSDLLLESCSSPHKDCMSHLQFTDTSGSGWHQVFKVR